MKDKMTEQTMRFNGLFRQLVSEMTKIEKINVPLIEKMLVEMCALFRLSKTETYLYNSLEDEKKETGNAFPVTIREKGSRFCSFAS